MSMNPEIKAQWVSALRSGEYQQGSGVLTMRTDEGDKDCCLGVLCKLAISAGVKVEVGMLDVRPGVVAYDGSTALMPWSVLHWAGLSNSLGAMLEVDGLKVSLPQLNDGNRDKPSGCEKVGPFTFEQIADVIEANL